ncbi:expressed unknown protein [Seminavis robusta]|uniref:Uncharacterized protein n=1 Tax=Seminavis robusta TaxID=568900 RepID=A0A9N8H4A9_9STRA|nr:expressed unknown protein [Seminavis robusta]|eukprot:Sro109_g054570.1 n/a (150) ;mRNA; r:65819-66268
MTRLCFALLAILTVATAFTTPAPLKSVAHSKPLFMFSAEDGKASAEKSKGLSEVAPGESADALQETTAMEATSIEELASTPQKETMMVKNRNTGEMMEVEVNESYLANAKLELNWWAWGLFVALPFILLANDVLHFIPADGPLKAFVKY